MNRRKDSARRNLEKEFKEAADREEAIYRQNFNLNSPWYLLPPEIKEYIIHPWQNSLAYDHLHGATQQHCCDPVLYKAPKELKKAWKLGDVYKTDCRCYYGGYDEEGSYPGTCRYTVRFLGGQTTQEELDQGITHLDDSLHYIPTVHKCIVSPFYDEDKQKIWPHWRSTAKTPAKRS